MTKRELSGQRHVAALSALLLAALATTPACDAFVGNSHKTPFSVHHGAVGSFSSPANVRAFSNSYKRGRSASAGWSSLRMAQEDFQEQSYTEAAWSAIASLPKVAEYYSAGTLEAPMLLDALLNPSKSSGGGDAADAAKAAAEKVLNKAGVDIPAVRGELETYMGKQPKMKTSGEASNPRMGSSLMNVLEQARIMKSELKDSFVSVEGLVLGMAKRDDKFFKNILSMKGVSYDELLKAVQELRKSSGPANSRTAETMYDALNKYGIDFTERARQGKLDPVIGRDDEIRRAIQILSRRTKNNPVLIGTICFSLVGRQQFFIDPMHFVVVMCVRFNVIISRTSTFLHFFSLLYLPNPLIILF
jgi:hypothetical protein